MDVNTKKIISTHLVRIKLPKNLKPCPFCGSESIHGWTEYYDHKNPDCFYYKSQGRMAKITCENCGIGISFGYFGRGIKDKMMFKMISEHWNRRI